MASKESTNRGIKSLGNEKKQVKVDPRWRNGKWTVEETDYIELLMEEFRFGTLPLAEGTSLRYFLSKMLNCNPKRISKRYENTNYNGKQKYEASTVAMSFEVRKRRLETLREYERRFLAAVKRLEDELTFDERHLGKAMEEEDSSARRASLNSSNVLGQPASRNGFQNRVTIEHQAGGDFGIPGSLGGSTASLRDMSLSNTANMSLTLPAAFTSPFGVGKPQLRFAADAFGLPRKPLAIDYVGSSYNQNLLASRFDTSFVERQDPLAWQANHSARRMFMAERQIHQQNEMSSKKAATDRSHPSALPHYRKVDQGGNLNYPGANSLSFPELSTASKNGRRHSAASTMDRFAHLHFASRQQNSSMTASSGLNRDGPATNDSLLRQAQTASFGTNFRMTDDSKRGHGDILGSVRPTKRRR